MIRIKRLLLFLFLIKLIIINSSCEGSTCSNGVIYDLATKEPIDSVKCTVITGSEEKYSDNSGRYNVCNDFGGCTPKCSDIIVEYSKNGYKTKKITNPSTKKIYLIQTQ